MLLHQNPRLHPQARVFHAHVSAVHRSHAQYLWGGALAAVLLAIYALYHQGFSGGPWFDDPPNLADLSTVSDLESALAYIMQSKGGPLGRPLALASFTLNAPSWPDRMEDFLHANTCIHLLNGTLLIWLCYRLIAIASPALKRPEWPALLVGLLWLGHPLLISTSLMTVQRMTTLAATFTLTGLLLFIIGQSQIERQPKRSFWLMSLGIAGGTALSTLSKEVGVLTPLYALILQATLLTGTRPAIWYLWWRRIFLILPQCLLLGYLGWYWRMHGGESYAIRDFTPGERVITQGRVLLEYLGNLVVPRRDHIGPIQDDYLPSRGLLDPIGTLPSLVLWLSAFSLALAWRKRLPVFAFAALWFLGGHSLESNIFSLELYFEHRNYLPSIGPLFAIVLTAWSVQGQWQYAARTALAVYICLILVIGIAAAGVWGDRLLAAQLWHNEHPTSERGAQSLSLELYRHRDYERARQIILQASADHPLNPGLALQSLQTSCGLGQEDAMLARILGNRPLLLQGNVNTTVCESLRQIGELTQNNQCGPVTTDAIHKIATDLLQNPITRRVPLYTYCVHSVQSTLFASEGNLDQALKHLETAFEAYPVFVGDAEMLAALPASAGLKQVALEKIEYAMTKKPANPVLAKRWETRLLAMKQRITAEDGAP